MKAKSFLNKCLLCLLFFLITFCPTAISKANYSNGGTVGLNIGFLCAGANSAEEPVYFADPNLKAVVEETLGVTDPTPADMSGLDELDAYRGEISDLTGLQYASNLLGLNLTQNQVCDLSPISGLTNLQRLYLSDNQISDISPLSGLTNLQHINLSHNQIGNNLSPLSGLVNLIDLGLQGSQISDISPLSELKNLLWLFLGGNQISDLSALSGLSKLETIWLFDNQISNISPISELTNLKILYLSSNQICDISSFSSLTNLEKLKLGQNQIADISSLSELTNLEELYLWANPLNVDAYNIYIPMLESYGTEVYYDPLVWRTLTVSSTEGGSVIEPGEGDSDYANGTIVDIHARADTGYYFVEWTGSAVVAGKVTDPYSAETTVTMDADYTLGANFEPIEVTLIYVDDDAPGANVGSDWANAINSLQNALLLAYFYEKPVEIRVAQGIYTPDKGIGIMPGDRDASFQLIDGVTIKGGFAGFGEPDPDARDIEQYESILSGDLNGDDDPNFTNILDNSFHVVTASGTDTTAILDGFTITAGNADGVEPYDNGGGIYNVEGSPMLIDCILSGNSTTGNGGGMFNDNSAPALLNCIFSGNSVKIYGGGMYNNKSNPILNNCTFIENSGWCCGGGIYNKESEPMLSDCAFYWNFSSAGNGGGMFNYRSNPGLLNCIFSGNWVMGVGGGMVNGGNCDSILTECIFSGNRAEFGGGIYINDSNLTLMNCTFSFRGILSCNGIALATEYSRNPSHITLKNCIIRGEGRQIFNNDYSTIEISYSNVPRNQTAIYDPNDAIVWGVGNIDEDPLFAARGYWVNADDPNVIAEPYQLSAVWIDGDYHLKSLFGRWNPKSESWVIDDVTSPCIDTGDPNSPVGLERFPNGDRINMGAYGGTAEASLSPLQLPILYSKAYNPYPRDGASGVDDGATLSWTAGLNAVFHDVYFGIYSDSVTAFDADTSDTTGIYRGRQAATSYTPPESVEWSSSTYYWRIDEVDSEGNIVTGDVWTFNTNFAPPKGRACFVGDTPVRVSGIAIPISEVAAGQNIGYLNFSDKVEIVQEHEGTFTLYDIALESGNCITVAENHYFMSEAGRWLSLHDLKEGGKLKTSKGSVRIRSIKERTKPYTGKVYNLKIKDSDRYMIGEDSIIVRDY